MVIQRALAAAGLGLFVVSHAAAAPDAAAPRRPAGAAGTIVIPDKFLRRWDPVTIFFVRDVGPAGGGAEDQPQRFVTMTPTHAGAFRWLDARTLQFKPAEPWPSLARISWKAEDASVTLMTLMAAPTATLPADDAEGLPPVEEITLTFAEPLEAGALAQMTTIEIRPLPGIGGAGARWLTKDDFTVKTVERKKPGDPATYVLVPKEPIPLGVRALVHLRLSLDDKTTDSFRQIAFSTGEPFRVVDAGCRDKQFPVTPEGTRYTKEQAIRCGTERRALVVDFSAVPRPIGPIEGRNLAHFTPAVNDLAFSVQGKTLEIAGDFAWDTLYAMRLAPGPLADVQGRRLEMKDASEVYVYFPRKADYVKWGASQGIVERTGPQMVPVEGRGEERVDLRILAIDPLDRSFWPFPDQPIVVDESRRPPGPGEEPPAHAQPERNANPSEIARHIANLGSPQVSTLVTLPLKREGGAATFGVDLAPHLARIAGAGQPGTYLVGLRDLSSNGPRSWMRVQATDLSLSTVEEPTRVRFVVTSLATGQPVAGARVRVEGTLVDHDKTTWATFAEGTTEADGSYLWPAPGPTPFLSRTVRRIHVEKGTDSLLLDPTRAPERYADNQWSESRETWLQWAFDSLSGRGPAAETLCHIFTERPVYRPEEEVHIKGYLRRREAGRLTPVPGEGWVIVEGPGDLSWKYPATLTAAGSFYHKFAESQLATGVYRAHWEDKDRKHRYGEVAFRMEAYRIPRFEVALHAPDDATLDKEFDVSLTATYYAGGKVGGQPVQWRVTQFPYEWTPKLREGFRYSSDGRYSNTGRFESSPRLEKEDKTSEDGSSSIVLNPAIEPTAQPRSYVVEATVTGADDQTVTATRRVLALPSFVLGLKAPRYVEHAKEIAPEVIVVASDGSLVADKDVSVRLLRREWHSHLRASDFSDGVARYVTDVVDEKVSETKLKSGKEPLVVRLPIAKAGVYVVEVEAHDRLDRAQVVSVDLYAGGDEPVAWQKPVTRVFSVATDKASYDPGATAAIVLKSPFQSARALAIVEAPEGNQYQWVPVEGGAATFRLPIVGHYAPRIPVHFVLVRGRVAGTAPAAGNSTDLGKPATMAATAWLDVNPVANQAVVKLTHPEKARPGQKIDVKIDVSDPQGKPLAGEVTLWLVDQAVLSLGKEQRLDPLPDFITKVLSHLGLRDTRGLAFGLLPFAENPGGDQGEESKGLLDKTTVRKNFKTVPYFNPAIQVGPDGTATVAVDLPDDLTNFKLRAKVAAGAERFGYATSQVAVRLPVIVQPALPRFVRPGDTFTAAAIGRIVEGAGGPGAAEARVDGVRLLGAAKRELVWAPEKPERVEFPVAVDTPGYTADGQLARKNVSFRIGVTRASDQASDAFEVTLPIRDDRDRVTVRALQDLKPGVPLVLPEISEKTRPGTLRREVLVASEPELVRMAAGLDFLLAYPYGCTEQQVSRARAYVALKKFRSLLHQGGSEKEVERAVREALDWIPTAVDANGLVAYWPCSSGYVSLTAWVVQFLVEARDAGFAVDPKLFDRLTHALEQALRSDYGRFIDGESFAERTWALAALAQAGSFNAAYATELARQAQFLNLEGVANVLLSFARAKQTPAGSEALAKQLWDGVVVRLYQGREAYGGLQDKNPSRNGLILPSETRTVAEIARTVARIEPTNPRLPMLIDALVTLGRGDGWGSTNANASALLALAEVLKPPFAGAGVASVRVSLDGKDQALALGPDAPTAFATGTGASAGQVLLASGGGPRGVVARTVTSYVPAADGSQVAARSDGFVVTRELLRVAKDGGPADRIELEQPGTTQAFAVGDVIEDHVRVVNPKERHHVAITVPLAAGVEPLNPHLATAPPEARPAGTATRDATYAAYLDDQVAYFFDTLPAGTYDFYFRTRATTPGRFTQPPAKAEMMYDGSVRGTGNGATIAVERKEK